MTTDKPLATTQSLAIINCRYNQATGAFAFSQIASGARIRNAFSAAMLIAFGLAPLGCDRQRPPSQVPPYKPRVELIADLPVDEMWLVAIDPSDEAGNGFPVETAYKYPVLGKVEITKPEDQKALLDALRESIRLTKEDYVTGCFDPRHFLRVTSAGVHNDYLVCFECDGLILYRDGKRIDHSPITDAAQELFNKYLKDAGVPLAPPESIGRAL